MFNSHLPFVLRTIVCENDPSFHVRTYVYRVKTEAGSYIIHAEEYVNRTYVLKFYPARFKHYKNKFKLIAGDNVVQVVLGTCLRVFESFYLRDREASFGFIATGSVIGNFVEPQRNNQRFRIYKQVMQNFFGGDTFSHFVDVENSAYLMVNRNNDIMPYVRSMQERFVELYPDMFNLHFAEL